jgi:hypothetical protein
MEVKQILEVKEEFYKELGTRLNLINSSIDDFVKCINIKEIQREDVLNALHNKTSLSDILYSNIVEKAKPTNALRFRASYEDGTSQWIEYQRIETNG